MRTDLRIYNHKESVPTIPSNGAKRLKFYEHLPALFEGTKLQIMNVPGFGDGWCALEVIDVVIFHKDTVSWQVVTCKPGAMINPDAERWVKNKTT